MDHGAGVFIAFEGIDGCGKTTQVNLLYRRLMSSYTPVICHKFPSKDATALLRELELRNLLANPFARSLMFAMDRYAKAGEIRKGIEAGKVVLCDRFAASGAVYAKAAHNVPMGWGADVERYGVEPDLYVFIEILNPMTALTRNRKCEWKHPGPYDDLDMQIKVYHAYMEYFVRRSREGGDVLYVRVTDDMTPEMVHAAVWEGLNKRFPMRFK